MYKVTNISPATCSSVSNLVPNQYFNLMVSYEMNEKSQKNAETSSNMYLQSK